MGRLRVTRERWVDLTVVAMGISVSVVVVDCSFAFFRESFGEPRETSLCSSTPDRVSLAEDLCSLAHGATSRHQDLCRRAADPFFLAEVLYPLAEDRFVSAEDPCQWVADLSS